tara:strand:+ start:4562 stop:5344 length:783 start_codon:yes stop_codon:yes gene_type:complete
MATGDQSTSPTQGHAGPGTATIPPSTGIYRADATPTARLGDRIQVGDRVFRYAKFVNADLTAPGTLLAVDESAINVVDIDDKATVAAAGSTSVTLTDAGTLGSVSVDDFAGGILHITGGSGVGYSYGIKSNTASSSNAVTLTLYDQLVEALSASSDVAITGNSWSAAIIATDGTDESLLGVNVITIDISVAPYGWIQTYGPATVLVENAAGVTLGAMVSLSDSTAGSVQDQDAFTEMTAGQCLATGDSDGHTAVRLTLYA